MPTSVRILVRGAVAFGLLCAACLPAWPGEGVFTPFGPSGGRVSALAIDPGDVRRVYVGTSGAGVFRSEDGGVTWLAASLGLGADFGFWPVSSFAIDPIRPQTIYAGTLGSGVFKSVDGGRSWRSASRGLVASTQAVVVWALLIDPFSPKTLLAGTSAGVFRSVNGAESWSPRRSGLPLQPVLSLARAPDRGAHYAGLLTGIFRSDNGGRQWLLSSRGLPAGTSVHALAADPIAPKHVLAGTSKGLFRSTDGGREWRKVDGVAEGKAVTALAYQSAPRRFLAGSRGAGIFVSPDGTARWEPAAESPPDREITALAPAPDQILAGTASRGRLGGVFRSRDGGATWIASSSGLTAFEARALAFDPIDPAVQYLAAGEGGMLKSEDGGATWRQLDLGTTPFGASFIYTIVVDPVSPRNVYASDLRVPMTLKSADAGETWRQVASFGPRRLAIDPRSPGALWAANFPGLYHTPDGGTTWNQVDVQHPGFLTFADVVVDPRDPNIVWTAGGILGGDPRLPVLLPFLLRTGDGGATWQRRDQGLDGGELTNLLLAAEDPDLVLVSSRGLFRSEDSGISWSLLTLPAGRLSGLAAIPSKGTLFAALLFPSDLIRSVDGGESWTSIRARMGPRQVNFVTVDPHRPGRLFAGTLNGGLWSYTEP